MTEDRSDEPLDGHRLWVVRHVFELTYATFLLTVLGALVAGLAWHFGARSTAYAAISLAGTLVVGSVAIVFRAREWKRRGIAALRRDAAKRDPGDSPVPWISTSTWRRGHRWDPGRELLYGARARARARARVERPCVEEASIVRVTPEDREAAPIVDEPLRASRLPVPDAGTPEQHEEALAAAPPSRELLVRAPSWPICCDRLATLVGHAGVDAGFRAVLPRAHFLYEEARKGWGVKSDAAARERAGEEYGHRELDEGAALFHCRACGRVYLGSCHP